MLGAEQPLSWSVPGGATLPDRVDRQDAQDRWAPWVRQASSEPVVSEGSHLLLDYGRQPEGTPWPQAQDKTFGPAADEVQKIFRNFL